MITLDIKHIKDYMYCPESYRQSYVVNTMPSQYMSITRLYEYAMQKAAYRFFWSAYHGEPFGLKTMRKSFGEIFIGQRSKINTIALSSNTGQNIATVYERHGVEDIKRFYTCFENDLGTPIIINHDYELTVGNVLLKGTLPIVREYKKEIELLDIRSDHTYFKRNTEWIILSNDIELIAAGLAFKQVFNTEVKTFKVYMLSSGSIHIIQKKLTALERFYTIINSVSKAIKSGIYFPSYNYNCLNCAYNNICIIK